MYRISFAFLKARKNYIEFTKGNKNSEILCRRRWKKWRSSQKQKWKNKKRKKQFVVHRQSKRRTAERTWRSAEHSLSLARALRYSCLNLNILCPLFFFFPLSPPYCRTRRRRPVPPYVLSQYRQSPRHQPATVVTVVVVTADSPTHVKFIILRKTTDI